MSPSGAWISKYVFRVDENMLKVLDELEKSPIFYTRTQENFEIVESMVGTFQNGDIVECGIYLLKDFKDHLLELPFLEVYCNSPEHPWVLK